MLKIRWSAADLELLRMGFSSGYKIRIYSLDGDSENLIIDRQVIPALNQDIAKLLQNSSDSASYLVYQEIMHSSFNLRDKNEYEWKLVTLLFGLQDNFELTKALGMGADFTDLDPEFRYHILIELALEPAAISNEMFITYPHYETLPKPEMPSFTCNENRVSISGIMTHSAEFYSSYYLEKQTSTESFHLVTSQPSVINYVNEKPYLYILDSINGSGNSLYRWRGKDMWGDYGPYSEVLEVVPCQHLYLAPQSVGVSETDDGKILIQWEIPAELESALRGFKVCRSGEKFSKGQMIHEQPLVPTQFSCLDDTPQGVAYYMVEALYKDGTQLASHNVLFSPKDITPPSVPVNLQVSFDTLQFIGFLSWNKNTDPDLSGYRLYFSNSRNGEKFLVENANIIGTARRDTISKNILQNERWYWVTSRDFHGNESFFSEPVTIKFPDRFPPAPPRISLISPSYGYVGIHWYGSPSEDVRSYTLMSRSIQDSTWIQQTLIGQRGENIIRDTSVAMGDTVVYIIMVEDSSGLRAQSNQRSAALLDRIYLPKIPFYQAQLNDSVLQITFDYPESINVKYFKLMAGHAVEAMTTYRMFAPQELILRRGIQKRDDPMSYALFRINIPRPQLFDAQFRLGVIEQHGKVSPMSEPFSAGNR